MVTSEEVYRWLEEVKDPEIPVLSIIDLGVITGVTIKGNAVTVEMTPTFTGCPAIDLMKSEITEVLKRNEVQEIRIDVTFREPWTSDRISEKGRKALTGFGLAPPPQNNLFEDLDILEHASCPRCSGSDTELKTPFGSTLCRAIYYCRTCRESFEQFKPVG